MTAQIALLPSVPLKRCCNSKASAHPPGALLPKDSFGTNKNKSGGLQTYCRKCSTARRNEYHALHPERERQHRATYLRSDAAHAANLRNKFGLALDVYRALQDQQGNRCAICGCHEPGTGRRRWLLDHCHSTGAVRGLLCDRCNIGIGSFRDDPDRLERAAEYLRTARTGHVVRRMKAAR